MHCMQYTTDNELSRECTSSITSIPITPQNYLWNSTELSPNSPPRCVSSAELFGTLGGARHDGADKRVFVQAFGTFCAPFDSRYVYQSSCMKIELYIYANSVHDPASDTKIRNVAKGSKSSVVCCWCS